MGGPLEYHVASNAAGHSNPLVSPACFAGRTVVNNTAEAIRMYSNAFAGCKLTTHRVLDDKQI